ncbi:MAG: YfaZ family outer membrane protein [Thiohalospira sp.]|uniref:YfaZ family outer membrane protein n=1 Tax=Thiohalospira sp. TaxID=3080549 RepID=UPI00397F78F3
MRRIALAGLLSGLAALPVQAGQLDLNLNDDAAYAQFGWAINQDQPGDLNGEAGLYYTTDDVYVGNVGLMVVGETGSSDNPLEAGVGVKALGVHMDDNRDDFDSVGLAPGLALRYYPAAVNRLVVGGRVHYAPNVVSFGDADSLLEAQARVEYQIIPQAFAYLGYRHMEAEPEGGGKDITLDEGGHLGVRILFQ